MERIANLSPAKLITLTIFAICPLIITNFRALYRLIAQNQAFTELDLLSFATSYLYLWVPYSLAIFVISILLVFKNEKLNQILKIGIPFTIFVSSIAIPILGHTVTQAYIDSKIQSIAANIDLDLQVITFENRQGANKTTITVAVDNIADLFDATQVSELSFFLVSRLVEDGDSESAIYLQPGVMAKNIGQKISFKERDSNTLTHDYDPKADRVLLTFERTFPANTHVDQFTFKIADSDLSSATYTHTLYESETVTSTTSN